MVRSSPALGTHTWTVRTGGRLDGAEARRLLAPLLRAQAVNVLGRVVMAVGLHSGKRASLDLAELVPPRTELTRAAEREAQQRLTSVLLEHSHRAYAYGMALAVLERVDVDRELLFAAAMLHDIGLVQPQAGRDFTLASARAARDVAERVGLSTAATDLVRDAITLHHTPGVSRAHGSVAYLLSAGAGVDVMGLRVWQLPPATIRSVLAAHPRSSFPGSFRTAWAAEAAAVPGGRARYLRRYGAFDLGIRLAPFTR